MNGETYEVETQGEYHDRWITWPNECETETPWWVGQPGYASNWTFFAGRKLSSYAAAEAVAAIASCYFGVGSTRIVRVHADGRREVVS